MRLINTGILMRWENWATVLLMLLIAIFAINSLSRLILKETE
jgi:Na+-transporting methylmalonyl-CoA/oxaloacetate decarboxylase gamma subunit